MKLLQAIIESYLNGQFKQMAEQMEEYGLYSVLKDLHAFHAWNGERCEFLTHAQLFDIAVRYNFIKYR